MKKIVLIMFFSFASLFAFEQLTDKNFEEKLKNKNAIVDFYAVWCPPCKVLNKRLQAFDKIKTEDITIYKVNIDKYRDLAIANKISQLPSLVYFKNGKALKKIVGIQSVEELKNSSNKIFDLKGKKL